MSNPNNNNDNIPVAPISTGKSTAVITYGTLHFIAFLFAIYLSFKCHGGFNLGSFIVALFCPWIYIIWTLVTRGPRMCTNYIDGHAPGVLVTP